ncbi:MAG: transcription elongation factor GreA [Gammaproteobacteria bacterium GWE2_42_36]|nr:MAG: transcription elongation factor GreA [Gammaproteobacteria bacterium GWE2_42_36]HCU05066.1 transcription elongation factor GreA [Coxiellaceae bacterium]
MLKRVPMTTQGAVKLREELQQLKHVERPRVIQAIAEARAHGDLKENAEYHAAREQQGFIEGRIGDIEGKLSMAEIIDISKIPRQGRVIFGTTVVLSNLDTNEKVTYQIVGDDEADIQAGKISVNSPVARAMIGKIEGDEVIVKTPALEVHYEIVEIRYE